MQIYDHAGQPYEADLVEGDKYRELERENAKLKALMRRAIPTVESRLTDYEDEFKAACK